MNPAYMGFNIYLIYFNSFQEEWAMFEADHIIMLTSYICHDCIKLLFKAKDYLCIVSFLPSIQMRKAM